MKVGTKSVLFGVHCFLAHPCFVALAWIRLYGFPWDPRIWVAFFVHDLGYWGKPNMDGPEGQSHPELGGRIMGFLFDHVHGSIRFWAWILKTRILKFLGLKLPKLPTYSQKWKIFTLFHSRYYAARREVITSVPSKLCAADKLAFCFEPYWLYMLRAKASGELKEYVKNSGRRYYSTYSRACWYEDTYRVFLKWTAANYKI